MISTIVTIVSWFSWRTAPGSQRSGVKLGPMDKAQEWYDAKLTWYRSLNERKPVTDCLKRRLTTFFADCPLAWNKVLEVERAPPLKPGEPRPSRSHHERLHHSRLILPSKTERAIVALS